MEKNYFETLNSIECKTEKKKDLTYISWSDAWLEVKKLHPEATYTIYENADGFPFWESKFGIDCKVGVTINGIEHIVRLPVMDGANKAMKAESYEYKTSYGIKTVSEATTFDINKTIMRAFAKAIAMHGLGLYVFRGEDLPEVEEVPKAPVKKDYSEPSNTNIAKKQGDYSQLDMTEWIALVRDEKDINHLSVLETEFDKYRKTQENDRGFSEKQYNWFKREIDTKDDELNK